MLSLHSDCLQAEEPAYADKWNNLSAGSSDAEEYEVFEMSTDNDTESSRDSVTKRRRHAVYFPKPPVWCVRPYPQGSFSADSSVTSSSMDGGIGGSGSQLEAYDSFDDAHIFYPLDSGPSSEETLPGLSSQASFRQVKPGLCTRLQSCKDVRVSHDEGWAIQEGSLVISLDPSYTLLECDERQPDEFDISSGDVYVVCRLYADLWALCAKASLSSLSENNPNHDMTNGELAFLPLCAVTLAANYGAFVRRCSSWATHPDKDKYPGNGLPVTPPERSHSLNASRQIFEGGHVHVFLPPMDLGACNNFAPAERDYVPLDSTLEQILCELGGRRDRLHRLRMQLSLRKFWSSLRPRSISRASIRIARRPFFCLHNRHFSVRVAGERLRFWRFERKQFSSTR